MSTAPPAGVRTTVRTSSLALVLLATAMSIAGCSERQAPSSTSTEAAPRPNAAYNQVVLTADNHILWNGRSVTESQFAELLAATRKLHPEPELGFQPDADASYDLSAKVLGIVDRRTITDTNFYKRFFSLVQSFSREDGSSH